MLFLRLQGQDDICVVDLVNHSSGYPAALNGLFEPVAVHGIREDPQHPPSGPPRGCFTWRLWLVLESHRLSGHFRLADLEATVCTADAQLWLEQTATQETVHDFGHIVMHSEAV